MKMAKRRQYPKEFKLNAISLVLDQGHSRTEAARILNVDASLLGRWIKQLSPDQDPIVETGDKTDSGNGTWVRHMVQEIVDSRSVGPTMVENLDEFLIWLGGKPSPVSDQISAAFEERSISVEAAQTMALWVLDEYLFADDQVDSLKRLGLHPGSSPAEIRKRYHRLIRVYHPDKQAFDSEWGTKRTEALNTVYTRLKQKPADARSVQRPPPPRASARGQQAYPSESVMSRVRKQLGPTESVTRLFLISMSAIAAVFVVIVYIGSLTEEWAAPMQAKTESARTEQTRVVSSETEEPAPDLSSDRSDTESTLTSNVLEAITPTSNESESGEKAFPSTAGQFGDNFGRPEPVSAKKFVPSLTASIEPEVMKQAQQTQEHAVVMPATETVVAAVYTPAAVVETKLVEPTLPRSIGLKQSEMDEMQPGESEMVVVSDIPAGHNDNHWLFAQPPEYWTLQLVSTPNEAEARSFIVRKKLEDGAAYFESRIGDKPIYYVLYRSYPTLAEAKATRSSISEIRSTAIARKFLVLQNKRCVHAPELVDRFPALNGLCAGRNPG